MEGIGGTYAEGRRRLTALVAEADAVEAARPVPACPAWTVHDVIAHLAGGCADVLAGNVDGITTAAWADDQVRRRQERTMAELLDEWATTAPPLEASPDHLPPPLPAIWILDLITHEQDVRGALAQPGARDTPALLRSLDFLVEEGLRRQLAGRSLGPLTVRTPATSWEIDGDSEPAVLEVSTFELFRALTGRRSVGQIAAFGWSVDPAPFLPAFQFGTFTTRVTDLRE